MSDDVLDEFDPNSGKLPGMLNVLTILTFIWSGLMTLMSIYNLLTLERQREQFEQSMAILDESNPELANGFVGGMMESARLAVENAPVLNSTSLIVALLCIFAAYMMRNLKRNGYFLYVAACLIEIIVPIAIIGGGIVSGMILAGSIFSILFIILYGVNLKHLK